MSPLARPTQRALESLAFEGCPSTTGTESRSSDVSSELVVEEVQCTDTNHYLGSSAQHLYIKS